MDNSILNDVKKILGIAADYDAFDTDVMVHINTAFSTLHQLGLGPEDGFMIEDDTSVWGDFLSNDKRLNNIKTYIYLRVRVLFDPPTNGFTLTALREQIQEFEWRLSAYREEREYDHGLVDYSGTPKGR